MLSVTMVLMDYRDSSLSPIRTSLNIVLHPLQLAVDAPFQASREMREFFVNHATMKSENAKLQELVNIYAARDQKYHSIAQENIRFRKELNATQSVKERFMLAEILSVSRDPYRQTVRIDKGSKDGLYRGQVLLAGNSIYGQVFRVEPNSAVILQLTDTKHAIPVRNNRTGLGAIAVGSGRTNELEIKNVEANVDIRTGDTFFSSGLGQLFPADFPVAMVASVAYNPGDSFMRVKARTLVDFSKSREVILIWRSNHISVLRASDAEAEAAEKP
ncbi:rod shape-determining protein MreC [Leucothrix arctica]|uniref:Cell shape-determining protein MreC n=2 Tax=Leucothrix arctica TaxID=1481894 RepID=A0A317CDF4_9GAMM|nr:rod shape-determining protein MreC [Leucothrix arctica]